MIADFDSQRLIKSFKVKGLGGAASFVDSRIAAWDIGKASLGVIDETSPVGHGVVGHAIKGFAATGQTSLKKLNGDDAVGDMLTLGNFVLRVV